MDRTLKDIKSECLESLFELHVGELDIMYERSVTSHLTFVKNARCLVHNSVCIICKMKKF